MISYSRSHYAVIRVYDAAGNVIETHEHAGDFKEWKQPIARSLYAESWLIVWSSFCNRRFSTNRPQSISYDI